MKKVNKKKVSKKSSSEYNLLVYIEDCSTKIKKFDSTKELGEFVDQFYKEHPDYTDKYSDNWVEYAITGINGEVHFFTDGLEVQ